MFADDLADAALLLMADYDDKEFINIGVGEDLSIKELAQTIKEVIEFRGELVFDQTKPDGTPRKLLDISKLKNLGWLAKTPLKQGIAIAYHDFLTRY
jgi:GDP-L-fucose synthase